MTFEVIPHLMKSLTLHNLSIHGIFYQNWFINEYDRNNLAKIFKCIQKKILKKKFFSQYLQYFFIRTLSLTYYELYHIY